MQSDMMFSLIKNIPSYSQIFVSLDYKAEADTFIFILYIREKYFYKYMCK